MSRTRISAKSTSAKHSDVRSIQRKRLKVSIRLLSSIKFIDLIWVLINVGLRSLIETKGTQDPETLQALEIYVEKSLDAAQYLHDKSEDADASHVLEEAAAVLKNEIGANCARL